jgi:pimeloyl-ACP methyl ester carboxylesterase
MTGWEEREIAVGDVSVTLLEAGAGRPLLMLHDELGHLAWSQWHGDLAARRRLIAPIAPGFRGPRQAWMRNVTDLARFLGRMLREQGLGPVDVVGFSFGGWVAAEMAVNDPAQFSRMVLVAPFGIKPSEGFIADMYIGTTAEYLRASVADPDASPEFAALFNAAPASVIESCEDARIETAQLAWEPYMHNPALERHVEGLDGLPTLVIWGEHDAILPKSAVEAYVRAIANSRLDIIPGGGHRPEIERLGPFLESLTGFLG